MKVPTPEKMSSGNWYIRLRLGGESVSVIEPTKAACVQRAQLIKAEYKAGKRQPVNTLKLGEVIDRYIKAREGVLSPSTIRGYAIIRRTRFLSVMEKPVDKIRWQETISQEAGLCAAKTLTNAWRFVVSCLRFSGVDVPEVQLPQIPSRERPYLEPDQILVFLDAIRDKPGEMGALLALHSLRRSEIHAVRRADVDLDNMLICVHGSVVQSQDKTFVEKETNKNKSSTRFVPITITRLVELIENAEEGLLVQSYPGTLAKQINRVCASVGLPEVGVHGLRHSFASLAHHLRMTELQTMRLGGWSDDATMRRVYTHLARKDVQRAGEMMTEFYKNAK